MNYTKFITDVLHDASAIARAKCGRVLVALKGEDNNQVLTEADLAIGQLLIRRIEQEYPDHNIIDEEMGVLDRSSDYTWVIDPIDGTSNFASGIPTYGIMLGLLECAYPVAGGIALPAFHEVCWAERGCGAFTGGVRLSVTKEERLLSALIAYGIDGHQEAPEFTRRETGLMAELILRIRNLRTSNSCFDSVMVASGRYGAYLNRTSKIWDNVAQHVIIEEAGGLYTDFQGNPLDYRDPLSKVASNYEWCAGSPALHRQLQEIIHQHI